ncbi:hypothetical protein F0P96_03670 [Hymenobacter busanensis]|uniref:Uncharacterized protein n=1 Tax=Hymenobacter busanensis TaxID=2607656 RepID=A0A7L4ZTR0_9BACT|nr:hypothetical protein [Hymenobacter busanensis]KAA9339725.1 hypothetical protein F0P96_03670 [Hymenobacter busanensis]QHJ06521.1 hypothetical protein GUY19_04080 [Hymenobacter busanensis]
MPTYSAGLLLGLGLQLAVPAAAQTVLLDGDVAADTAQQTFGPNRRLYRHLFGGYAVVAGPDAPGAELRGLASNELTLGLRHKLRLSQTLAVGADLRYLRQTYALSQNPQKAVPSSALHHRESLVVQRADAELWLRLNAGRRGNAIGHYFDVAGWSGWVAGTAHHTEDKPAGAAPARRVLTAAHGLNYMRRWAYGAGARVGSGRYALQARYRFSDLFLPTETTKFPELPRWTAGIEIGLF